jgi:hypothetical protein
MAFVILFTVFVAEGVTTLLLFGLYVSHYFNRPIIAVSKTQWYTYRLSVRPLEVPGLPLCEFDGLEAFLRGLKYKPERIVVRRSLEDSIL